MLVHHDQYEGRPRVEGLFFIVAFTTDKRVKDFRQFTRKLGGFHANDQVSGDGEQRGVLGYVFLCDCALSVFTILRVA